jgi:hypothetical protein
MGELHAIWVTCHCEILMGKSSGGLAVIASCKTKRQQRHPQPTSGILKDSVNRASSMDASTTPTIPARRMSSLLLEDSWRCSCKLVLLVLRHKENGCLARD